MNKKNVQIIDCVSPGNRFLPENGSGTAGWREHKWGRDRAPRPVCHPQLGDMGQTS